MFFPPESLHRQKEEEEEEEGPPLPSSMRPPAGGPPAPADPCALDVARAVLQRAGARAPGPATARSPGEPPAPPPLAEADHAVLHFLFGARGPPPRRVALAFRRLSPRGRGPRRRVESAAGGRVVQPEGRSREAAFAFSSLSVLV